MQQPLAVTLTKQKIAALKQRALRKRVWFRVLDRAERGLVDLTIRWVDNVKSKAMQRALIRILAKLTEQMGTVIEFAVYRGTFRAEQLSTSAMQWGNKLARSWATDPGFRGALGMKVLSV